MKWVALFLLVPNAFGMTVVHIALEKDLNFLEEKLNNGFIG